MPTRYQAAVDRWRLQHKRGQELEKEKRRKKNREEFAASRKEIHKTVLAAARKTAQLKPAKVVQEQVDRAEKMLAEIKSIAKEIRPFYDEALQDLAQAYPQLMGQAIDDALAGDKVTLRFLLEQFPKLLPEQGASNAAQRVLSAMEKAIEERGGRVAMGDGVLLAESGGNRRDDADDNGQPRTLPGEARLPTATSSAPVDLAR